MNLFTQHYELFISNYVLTYLKIWTDLFRTILISSKLLTSIFQFMNCIQNNELIYSELWNYILKIINLYIQKCQLGQKFFWTILKIIRQHFGKKTKKIWVFMNVYMPKFMLYFARQNIKYLKQILIFRRVSAFFAIVFFFN